MNAGSIVGLTSIGNAIYMSGLKWLVMLAPLGIVFYMSFGINKMSASKSSNNFLGFCSLDGFIFIIHFISLHWNGVLQEFSLFVQQLLVQ